MSSNDNTPAPPKTPADDLLGELESIKDLLEDDLSGGDLLKDDLLEGTDLVDDLDIDIPILDDIVAEGDDGEPYDKETSEKESRNKGSQNNNSDDDKAVLLDLNTIFDDNDDEDEVLELGLNLDDLDTQVAIPSFKLLTTSSEAATSEILEPDPESSPESTPESTPESGDSTEPTKFTEPAVASYSSKNNTDEKADIHVREARSEQQEDMFPDPVATVNTETTIDQDLATGDVTAGNVSVDNVSTVKPPTGNNSQPDFDIDLVIQEIVDEYIPVIESKLRERLSACSPDLLQQLADKHLKP